MFEISWGEILLMLTAAVLFLKPEDLPKVLRGAIKAWRWAKRFAQDIYAQVDKALMLEDLHQARSEIDASVKMIRGDDGQDYASYSLDDVKDASRPPAPVAPEEKHEQR